METGHNQDPGDPGSLSAEDERTLLALDKLYRNTLAQEVIPSRRKEWTFYLMSHRPPDLIDPEDPDYRPNYYMFFGIGPQDQDVSRKVFVLFMDEETGGYVRVVNVAGLNADYEEQGLDEDDLYNRPELTQEFWRTVELQGDLGTTIPNQEDMNDFSDIVASWQSYANREL